MHLDWEYEIKRFDTIKLVIRDELIEKTANSNMYKENMRSINKEMWGDVGVLSGLDSATNFMQHINFLKQNISTLSENDKKIKMLTRQLDSPYFARIDFKEKGYDTEIFYIGIYGLRRANTGEILIYDWRAPVSSMFYDYELGRASYECPLGTIEGKLTLKRQYRIEKGQLLLMFDNTIAIDDNILQDILAGSASNRMKTIVNTIQREQNRAIRYEGKRVIAVQGPAGSGKTSIALHRAAYLLYHHRNNLKAENICLFTPNGTFAKYISTVLPELGEGELHCITLTGLVQNKLGNLYNKYESYSEMMEWQLLSLRDTNRFENRFEARLESIRFKTSGKFISVLEKFVEVLENKIIIFEDIIINDTVFADKKELEELFHDSYHHMPIAKRLSRMEIRVIERVNEYEKQRRQEKIKELSSNPEYIDNAEINAKSRFIVTQELENVKSKVKNMLSINIADLYRMLFEDNILWNSCGGILSEEARMNTVNALEQNLLYHEDQAPILYLGLLLGTVDADNEIRHLIIDEAQDYSEVAYKLFSRIYFNCNITILGDLHQNISPISGIGSLQSAAKLIDAESFEYIELDKSYRSTMEIVEFASRIIPTKVTPYGRNGKYPDIKILSNLEELCSLITNDIKDFKEEGYHSIAVICRTSGNCRKVYKHLGKDLSASLIVNGEEEIPSGVVVIPSYLSKGIEFDVVITVVLSIDEYTSKEDRLFYTVCTRALHRLNIYTVEHAKILDNLNNGP